ncbi:ABC transporter substrate-binding protein [Roseateles violae]|uniref:Extracellular solute-binding protein n=1 Tax=Roseateles violae TaxID=3058042 RepID=A0ABT8DL78_9BURK|nr:extracellular solute-binding protein [Pelomonas sp. PFR6]MDN3919164.1 extracellular solute-binding protein [Pelomonas sp. PFR6]
MQRRAALLALLCAPALAQQTADRRALEAAARAEGRIVSVGMPDGWANWRATWADLKRLYGLEHQDLNMSSAEEIERMAADGRKGTVDIGDVGFEYAAVARGRGVSLPVKPALWEQIPDWAKDADGYWALAYTGTIAFAVNRKRVARPPVTWAELFGGSHTVLIGHVGSSAQGNAAVLAAAVALGGSETQLTPALAQFARLQREGRLIVEQPSLKLLERGEIDVLLLWDFQALGMRSRLARGAPEYEVLIPADGSITSGYTPIINRHAPHPNAALLVREFIFSDAGQLNLARGYARPIRLAQLNLPEPLRQGLLDEAQYAKARLVQPAIWAWEAKKLGPIWQREVLQQARR